MPGKFRELAETLITQAMSESDSKSPDHKFLRQNGLKHSSGPAQPARYGGGYDSEYNHPKSSMTITHSGDTHQVFDASKSGADHKSFKSGVDAHNYAMKFA